MSVRQVLAANRDQFGPVIATAVATNPFVIFDLSQENIELQSIDVADPVQFGQYIFATLEENNAVFGIGRYNEQRSIYDHSPVFIGRRSVHLGLDIWVPAETPVLAPFPGRIHSFRNNSAEGDYGPTIILEHVIAGVTFFTLYGHLSLQSLVDIQVGQLVETGQTLAWVGNHPSNGNWPSHLHFRIITDMLGNFGDFPGVCDPEEVDTWTELCPDPNLILQLEM